MPVWRGGCRLGMGAGQTPLAQRSCQRNCFSGRTEAGAGAPNCIIRRLEREQSGSHGEKMCGSGLQATVMAGDRVILHGSTGFAGRMVIMSRTQHPILETRRDLRTESCKVFGSMFLSRLEDACKPGASVGEYGECTAQDRQVSRQALDEFALSPLLSVRAASKAPCGVKLLRLPYWRCANCFT